MDIIKFGTDGWRAIIADTFTNANVARVATATALWLRQHYDAPQAVVGYDTRFGGAMFADITARILCAHGVRVVLANGFVSTPMVSYATKQLNAGMGVIITASHNPPSYNGYKLKANFGGPATPAVIKAVEDLIPEHADLPNSSADDYAAEGLLSTANLEDMYFAHVRRSFDLTAIQQSGLRLAYDAMYGAGQHILPRILPQADLLHCDYNPSFKGQAPEPIHKNLSEFAQYIRQKGNIDLGLATDGDADRIGLYNNKGNFIDSHHIILLLIHYLHRYKGLSGKVVCAFSVTSRAKTMCEKYGLPYQVTGIGFKYICEIMTLENVIVGGEESGGIAATGHVPERDGIWMGLLILELMAKTGKSLDDLIQEVYDVVGAFAYDRNDLHITESLKQQILDNCRQNRYSAFGSYAVSYLETLDGFKYHFGDGEWIMIRASGTEPLLRVYAEAATPEKVADMLAAAKATLLG